MPEFPETILESTADKICVIAAPGSGKTRRILIPKAKRILADESIDPKEVLLLTFSRLSAIDLRNLAKTAMDRVPRASTVHSFCLAFLLSENNHDARKRVESIILDFEKESMLSDLKLIFSHTNKRKLRKDLLEFSAAWAVTPHDITFEEDDKRRAFKSAIVNWLSEHEAMMMEEIVYFAVDLANKLESKEFLEIPKYIFVDEYQDLNRLEQEFVDILGQDSKLLVVVGDPDQSIYSFKHAYPEGIGRFSSRTGVQAHHHLITGRCPRKVVQRARDLLCQSDPEREALVQCKDTAIDGEIHFVQKSDQGKEFEFIVKSIAQRLRDGSAAKEIIVLVPRRKLANRFLNYAMNVKDGLGIPVEIDFTLALRPDFNNEEQEKILLLALLVKRDSLLHIRSYLGLGDDTNYAKEVSIVKEKYSGLTNALRDAAEEHWPDTYKRIRYVCERLCHLRELLNSFSGSGPAEVILNVLFPDDSQFAWLRDLFKSIADPEDSLEVVYRKCQDYIRTIPTKATSIRVMTLMASKGLEAEHVYIIGCNAGNIPGQNRSAILNDHDHRAEQRRLLYVGFTRASKSLTVSWSRYIPYAQAKGQHTESLGTSRFGNKKLVAKVGISEFLQDLPNIDWE